jgi:hypothetical protein
VTGWTKVGSNYTRNVIELWGAILADAHACVSRCVDGEKVAILGRDEWRTHGGRARERERERERVSANDRDAGPRVGGRGWRVVIAYRRRQSSARAPEVICRRTSRDW